MPFFSKKFLLKWFLIALGIKLFIFIYLTVIFHNNFPSGQFVNGIFVKSKDYGSYILPLENLINQGTYMSKEKGEIFYAYKMPGYLPLYAPLYFFFGRDSALTGIILANIFLDAIATVLLGIISFWIFSSSLAFYLTFFFYGLSFFVSIYNHYALVESISASAFVISLFFFIKAIKYSKKRDFLRSGIFFCWTIFLRTPSGIILPAAVFTFFIYSFYYSENFSIKLFFRNIFIWLLPFIICESVWVTRNFIMMNRFVPLATTMEDFNSPHYRSLLNLIKCWGGDVLPWIPRSEGNWFLSESNRAFNTEFSNSNPFNKKIFTPDYNYDSIVQLRKYYWLMQDISLSQMERKSYSDLFLKKSEEYKLSFKKNHLLQYYFFSPMKIIIPLVFIRYVHGSPFVQKNIFHNINKGIILLLYYLILFLGTAGIILSFVKKNVFIMLLFIPPFAYIIAHAYLGAGENRYLTTIFPFLVLFASYALLFFYDKFKMKKIAN